MDTECERCGGDLYLGPNMNGVQWMRCSACASVYNYYIAQEQRKCLWAPRTISPIEMLDRMIGAEDEDH